MCFPTNSNLSHVILSELNWKNGYSTEQLEMTTTVFEILKWLFLYSTYYFLVYVLYRCMFLHNILFNAVRVIEYLRQQ